MNKAEFLKALKVHLAVLKESEQVDILDEYAQHIDMKMERGMSEAEAIRDFGDIRELAAEILEAYHVNPQFDTQRKSGKEFTEQAAGQRMENLRHRFVTRGEQIIKHLSHVFMYCVATLWSLAVAPFRWLKKIWNTWRDTRRDAVREEGTVMVVEHTERKEAWSQLPQRTVRGMGRLGMGIVAVCLCCIRWIWNGCIMIGLFCMGGIMLSCLYVLGVLAVLLMQGYPLIGAVIGFLGATLCAAAVILFAIGLLRFQRPTLKSEPNPEAKQEPEPAVLEEIKEEHAHA